jgi:DNA-directed RNA polymerase specialized sigma24 family protein
MSSVEREQSFRRFARTVEPGLRAALVGNLGPERGAEALNDALVHGWRHWERVQQMNNPAGYLYRVGQRAGRRRRKRLDRLPDAPASREPWVEPGLWRALQSLSVRQRQVVLLVEALEWTQREAADLLGIRPASVQTHLARGMGRLRDALGAGDE